jgi:hypothetical protein
MNRHDIEDDPELEMDLLEERVAIVAEGCGISQFLAQEKVAKDWGYRNWTHARSTIRDRILGRKRDRPK